MKIVYILTKYPCKSEIFALREIKQLKKQGLDIFVFANDSDTKEKPENVFYRPRLLSLTSFRSIYTVLLKQPVKCFHLLKLLVKFLAVCPNEFSLLSRNLHTVCHFSTLIGKYKIQHIHSYFLSQPACIGLAISILSCKTFSISAHARDIFAEAGQIELKVKNAKFVTCCSEQGLSHLQSKLPEKYHGKLLLNHHGIEDGHDSSDIPKEKIILAVGRLIEKKGFETAIEAFKKLAYRVDCSLVIIGEGPLKKDLKELAYRSGLEDVCFTGWLSHSVVLEMIKKAAVLVVPSVTADDGDRDGIANVILEAFALGTPVIASSLAGIKEAVEDGKTGLLIEPGNSDQLQLAVRKILTDQPLSDHVTYNAKALVKQKFDLTANCRDLENNFKGGFELESR